MRDKIITLPNGDGLLASTITGVKCMFDLSGYSLAVSADTHYQVTFGTEAAARIERDRIVAEWLDARDAMSVDYDLTIAKVEQRMAIALTDGCAADVKNYAEAIAALRGISS